jgi:hypothetical protein
MINTRCLSPQSEKGTTKYALHRAKPRKRVCVNAAVLCLGARALEIAEKIKVCSEFQRDCCLNCTCLSSSSCTLDDAPSILECSVCCLRLIIAKHKRVVIRFACNCFCCDLRNDGNWIPLFQRVADMCVVSSMQCNANTEHKSSGKTRSSSLARTTAHPRPSLIHQHSKFTILAHQA